MRRLNQVRYIYHLPMWVHKLNLVGMFLAEVFPFPFFLIWPNSELYKISVVVIILLQVSEVEGQRKGTLEERCRGRKHEGWRRGSIGGCKVTEEGPGERKQGRAEDQ